MACLKVVDVLSMSKRQLLLIKMQFSTSPLSFPSTELSFVSKLHNFDAWLTNGFFHFVEVILSAQKGENHLTWAVLSALSEGSILSHLLQFEESQLRHAPAREVCHSQTDGPMRRKHALAHYFSLYENEIILRDPIRSRPRVHRSSESSCVASSYTPVDREHGLRLRQAPSKC